MSAERDTNPPPPDARLDTVWPRLPVAMAGRRRETDQVLPIEAYLTSEKGELEVEFLKRLLDRSMHLQLQTVVENCQANAVDFRSRAFGILVNNQQAAEGAARSELLKAYAANPTIVEVGRRKAHLKHIGLEDTAVIFNHMQRLLCGLARYDYLNGLYNPNAEFWQEWGKRLEWSRRGSATLYLPERYQPPTS